MINIPWLDEDSPFPNTSKALRNPNGLLAAGGELSAEKVLEAYCRGIFPWFSEDEPVLWWSPDPRCVVFPKQVHESKSMKKLARKGDYHVSFNQNFDEVIYLCGETRRQFEGTWITDELREAYCALHRLGFGKSVEVWRDNKLVGGLYGLAINKVFYGESMFSLEPNTSKLGFITLAKRLAELDYQLIDCQVRSNHLLSLGATEIRRAEFESILNANHDFSQPPKPGSLN
ncbi:leucyl/phenylalanyl-tRNA--protein transferase [Sessilibacter sp. MAH2]